MLGAAADYLGASPEQIALTDSTTMGLGLLYGGTLRGSPSAGLVCLEVEGVDPREAVGRLDQRNIVASVTPYATQYVRLGRAS